MTDPEQLSLDTKVGQVKASGPLMPVIVLGLAIIGAAVVFLHSDYVGVSDAMKAQSVIQANYNKDVIDRLDTLIAIQCATLRATKSQVQIPRCF